MDIVDKSMLKSISSSVFIDCNNENKMGINWEQSGKKGGVMDI